MCIRKKTTGKSTGKKADCATNKIELTAATVSVPTPIPPLSSSKKPTNEIWWTEEGLAEDLDNLTSGEEETLRFYFMKNKIMTPQLLTFLEGRDIPRNVTKAYWFEMMRLEDKVLERRRKNQKNK